MAKSDAASSPAVIDSTDVAPSPAELDAAALAPSAKGGASQAPVPTVVDEFAGQGGTYLLDPATGKRTRISP
jgi:hypothetical protein